MKRRSGIAFAGASVTLLLCLLSAGPATADVPAPEISVPSAENPYRTVIPLGYSVRLEDAATAAGRSPYDVVGYHYVNPGVEGEYFPRDDYTPAEFLAQFHADFGMVPAISGLVVRAEKHDDGAIVPRMSVRTRVTRDMLEGLPKFESQASGIGALWDQSRAAEAAATAERAPDTPSISSRSLSARASATTDWLPGWTQIAAYSGSSNQAIITTQHVWTTSNGEDLHAIPDYWATEFKVALYNESIEASDPGGTRQPWPIPSCTNEPDYKDRFWAKNYDWYSWSVFQVGSANNTTLGAYADTNDLYDKCSRQSLSIGIGFPRAVPYTPNHNVQLGTQIVAPKGTVTSNRVGSTIEAKEGRSCNPHPAGQSYAPPAYTPNTNCVGLNENEAWPGPGPQTKIILNDSRGAAYASDRTTRVKVYTVAQGLPQSCVSLWKDLFLDSQGYPVPQRECSAS